MQAATYPITANGTKQWKKLENFSIDTAEKKDLSFLYIGDNEDTLKYFSTYFSSGDFVENIGQAQLLVDTYTRNSVADAIFIDLPLNKTEFWNFCSLLKEKNFSSKTVMIYNEERLDAAKIKFLKQNELVDDVLDIDSGDINYSKKVIFLKRIKSRQVGLAVSKEEAVEEKKEKKAGYIIKRTIDILLASLALLFFIPIFILVAIAIKLESRGPVIYASQRAGKGFRVFKFFKFRTMEVGADQKIHQLAHLNQYGVDGGKAKFVKINNDPRITKVGKFLRKTSLDEMPQFFNVLKGDMSLVGNRPLPLYEASELTTNESVERFMAPAGITGLWQIKKRGKEEMSTEERISLDISYARNANVAYDLWIMAKTPTVLFQKSNG